MAARVHVPARARVLGASPRTVSGGRRGPAPLALAVYGALSVLTLGIAFAREQSPVETDAWMTVVPALARHLASIAGGVVLAFATIAATRLFVKRWGWAKVLHADLRPAVRDAGDGTILVLGIASGVAEELFFRGLLTPTLGLVAASIAFGGLHQLRGSVGWIWAGWATIMGLLFGALFLATGSLLGPIVAHVAINVLNLRFLRDTDVEPKKPRRLGGLLGDA